MELNVYSVLSAMQAVIPIMKKQGHGMIINVSSAVTKRYIPNMSAYSSTKYALNALSQIARQELEKDKIIVSSILPKMTATDFGKNSIGPRPTWDPNRPMPQIDSPELVAEKIIELINSEEPEITL
jgi:short-subunit dehydrogenase